MKNSKLYCFKGQFRKALVKPAKAAFKIISHLNPKDELLSSFYPIGDKIDYKEGELRSLELILQLPKSSYATMAIREILHITSEFDVQMQLNREYEKKYNCGKASYNSHQ